MHFSFDDHRYMARAIKLAQQGHFTTSPNPRVGCVLVKNGKIIGEGFHQRAGEGHAEVHALKAAGEKAQGATAYVTLEPCSHFGRTPPCAIALVEAKVSKVIAAMVDPNPQVAGNGLKILSEALIETSAGLLEQDARSLNKGFISLMEKKRSYVRCKLASSLDGQTAMANGESKWITSAHARQDVQRLRAQSCAVISSATSVIADNAKLTVRHSELGDVSANYPIDNLRQPIRVIIDSQNRLTPDLALFAHNSPIIIATTSIEKRHEWPHFVSQLWLPEVNGHVDLKKLLTSLAEQGLNDVLVEAGATLAGAFIEQNLVDELIVYQAPLLMGSANQGLVSLPHINRLAEAKSLHIENISQVGSDIKIVATFNNRA